ncbi:hypothetical protein CYMTET_9732 [Cymbomonas tetramitiformis]|uniref:Uncharacterized protein n=1 Tax=Cymbomonas tetramitiformis TaxID=36881 RepID=A0AAE0GQI8_9CHLO|nr:hypothetical protein CYMTET_9732 [Cymbomonas tetramitiformis]
MRNPRDEVCSAIEEPKAHFVLGNTELLVLVLAQLFAGCVRKKYTDSETQWELDEELIIEACRLCCVSRLWRHVIDTCFPGVWECINMDNLMSISDKSALGTTVLQAYNEHRMKHVRWFHLGEYGAEAHQEVVNFISVCPKVEQIDLTDLNCFSKRYYDDTSLLRALRPHCSHLKTLIISQSRLTDDGILQLCGFAPDLDMQRIPSLMFLERRVPSLPNLQMLNISDSKDITDRGVIALVSSCLWSLCDLDISSCPQVSDLALVAVGNMPNLRFLNMGQDSAVDASADIAKFSDNGMRAFAVMHSRLQSLLKHPMGGCLKKLNMNWCQMFTDSALLAVAVHFPALEQLDMEGCAHTSELGLAAVLHRLPRLVHLRVRGNQLGSGDEFMELPVNCTNLQTMEIGHCNSITCNAVTMIVSRCPNLATIRMFQCGLGLQDHALAEIGQWCAALQHLDLMHCPNVGNPGILAVAQGCRLLRRLTIDGCTDIDDDAVLAVVESCHNLQELELNGTVITDRSVLALAYFSKELQELRLGRGYDPPKPLLITAAPFRDTVADGWPKLQQLQVPKILLEDEWEQVLTSRPLPVVITARM